VFEYICRSTKGNLSKSNKVTSIKRSYLKALVNLTEKFKLKFDDEKYFTRFMMMLDKKDQRRKVLELTKTLFTILSE